MAGAGGTEVADLSLRWAKLADGKPWRLKRGKHYRGEPKLVQKEAEAAARQMGKAVVTSKDSSGKYEYLWVQFADESVPLGDPCPSCGGECLVRHSQLVAECSTCGSTLKLTDPPVHEAHEPARRVQDAGPPGSESRPTARERNGHGEVLESRLLCPEGREASVLLTPVGGAVETAFHFFRGGLAVTMGITFDTPRVRAFRTVCGPVAVEKPGLYRLRVHVPAGLLTNRVYKLKVGAEIKVDGETSIIAKRQELTVDARDPELTDPEAAVGEGVVRPSLSWNVTREPESPPEREMVKPAFQPERELVARGS